MLFKESWDSREARVDNLEQHFKDTNPHRGKMTSDQFDHLHRYTTTEGSRSLNYDLIRGELGDDVSGMHETIHALKRPVGRHLNVYSGSGHDFGAMARESKDGVIHSPAHISASYKYSIAHNFAGRSDRPNLLSIKLKPEDQVTLPLGASNHKNEHEVIIPAGTKLKYSHTTHHEMSKYMASSEHAHDAAKDFGDYDRKDMFKVHHFTIHSQE